MILLFTFPVAGITAALHLAIEALSAFSQASGLVIHPIKSAFVLKGQLPESSIHIKKATYFNTKNFVKYLGVRIGHVSVALAFAAPLAKAFRCAKLASYLQLSYAEKWTLLKMWIPPVLLLTARAYVADKGTVSALANIVLFAKPEGMPLLSVFLRRVLLLSRVLGSSYLTSWHPLPQGLAGMPLRNFPQITPVDLRCLVRKHVLTIG